MAYDNFENTPFDLNNDGHIDSNEAAYIYDTFYREQDESGSAYADEDDAIGGGGWYPTAEERKKMNGDMEDLRRRIAEEDRNKKLTVFGIWFALAIFVPNKLLAAILIFIVYIIATMFDVFR